ncbi:MAG TPA: hypothetical protein VK661_05315 [Planctomycetota bacterium]|jgi:hypothetical protein|nr:hypothetical protein [Planctomycetota bacterium]
MSETPEKRRREAQKVRKRELKAERRRLRKEGLLGQDNTGLFLPSERRRETVDAPGSIRHPATQGPPSSPEPNRG